MNGIILAIICAAIWAGANIFDKYLIGVKVKSIYGFALLCGIQNLVIGGIAALCISWSNISRVDLLFAALSGALLSINMIIYFKLLSKHDVSDIIGLFYAYPLLTAIISFFFLHERLSIIKYVAVLIIIVGVLLFNKYLKSQSIKFNMLLFVPYLIISAVYDIFMKVASSSASPLQGAILNGTALGIVAIILLIPHIKKLRSEIGNIPYSLVTMFITYLAVIVSFMSLKSISATFLSAIGATQPIFCLLFEKVLSHFEKSIKSTITIEKLVGMILIVGGVVLLSL